MTHQSANYCFFFKRTKIPDRRMVPNPAADRRILFSDPVLGSVWVKVVVFLVLTSLGFSLLLDWSSDGCCGSFGSSFGSCGSFGSSLGSCGSFGASVGTEGNFSRS